MFALIAEVACVGGGARGIRVSSKHGIKLIPSAIVSGLGVLLALDFNRDKFLCVFFGCTIVGGF